MINHGFLYVIYIILKLFTHILSGNKQELSSILTAFIYMEELSNDQ